MLSYTQKTYIPPAPLLCHGGKAERTVTCRRHESRVYIAVQQVANKLCKYFLFIIILLYDCYKYFIGSKIFMAATLTSNIFPIFLSLSLVRFDSLQRGTSWRSC